MNNKKYLSVLLFGALMLGTAGTFTGCIDNDEPAGIEELRGAKAELLRAKVAVETATAARENANATLILAQAETEKAKAAHQEATAEQQKLQNELLAARTEMEKARIEAEIAQLQQKMEEDALRHQQQMVTLQQSLAEAQRSYELALKQIEIAEATLSDQDKVTVGELKLAVMSAQNRVNNAANQVETAQENYYNALLGSSDSTNIKRLELQVERAKSDVAISKETLAKWNSFMENDTETADWREEIAVLEDSIKGINERLSEIAIDLAKATNSDEYKGLQAAQRDANTKYTTHATSSQLKHTVQWDTPTGTEKDYTVAAGPYAAVISGIDGQITTLKGILGGYTSQKKALLDELAANQEAKIVSLKKTSDDAIKAWQDAKAKYDAVGSYDDTKALQTIIAAETAYWTAIAAANSLSDLTQKANAQAIAKINYAKALVAYYTEAEKYVGCATNEVELELTDPSGTGKKKVKHTVLEWLSDETYSGIYLDMLMAPNVYGSTTAMYTVGGAIKTMGTPATLLADLRTASQTAFGTAYQYQSTSALPDNSYMRVQPTEAEVKAITSYETTCGALGEYLYASDPKTEYEAMNYKDIIKDYEAVIAAFEKDKADLTKEHTALKTALDNATAALNAYVAAHMTPLTTEQTTLNDRMTALNNVKSALLTAVDTWLPETSSAGGYRDTESFEAWLADMVKTAEDDVLNKESALAQAEINLTKANDGKYDAVSNAKKDLDDAMAELEAAQAELETATENLKTALEIMAKE